MTKDIQFSYAKAVSAEAVAAYEQQVKACQEMLVTVQVQATTSSVG